MILLKYCLFSVKQQPLTLHWTQITYI